MAHRRFDGGNIVGGSPFGVESSFIMNREMVGISIGINISKQNSLNENV